MGVGWGGVGLGGGGAMMDEGKVEAECARCCHGDVNGWGKLRIRNAATGPRRPAIAADTSSVAATAVLLPQCVCVCVFGRWSGGGGGGGERSVS